MQSVSSSIHSTKFVFPQECTQKARKTLFHLSSSSRFFCFLSSSLPRCFSFGREARTQPLKCTQNAQGQLTACYQSTTFGCLKELQHYFEARQTLIDLAQNKKLLDVIQACAQLGDNFSEHYACWKLVPKELLVYNS